MDQVAPDLESAIATFQAYCHQLAVTPESFAEARILEIGPGANAAVALQFLAAGAKHVTCLDRFVPQQFSDYHAQLYGRLRERLPKEQRGAFDDAVNLQTRQFNLERFTYVYGSFADLRRLVPDGSLTLIVSNAVIEEIYELESSIDIMAALLEPGGRMVHKIDFRDYGLFSNYGYSPLEFLTVPDWIYRPMAESTGQPNRKLIDAYRAKCRELRHLARFQEITRYTQNQLDLPTIRNRLLPRFRGLPDEDLLTESAYLVTQKS